MNAKHAALALGSALVLNSCVAADRPPAAASSSRASATVGESSSAVEPGREGDDAPVPVVTTHAVVRSVPVTIPAVGTVEAVSTVRIQSQVTGQLTAIGFTEGGEVRTGQLLFTIDPRPFRAAVAQAQAALARDTATNSNQQAQQTRYADLFGKGLLPRDQFEAQRAAASSSEAVLAVDRAAVEAAELNLQYARITAPISGRAGSLGVHVGDIVRPSDTTPMVVINQVSPIYVTFSVPGRYLADIRRHQAEQPLSVDGRTQPGALPGAQPPAPSIDAPDIQPQAGGTLERGHVTFIDNAIDTTTGTIRLRASFDNADRAFWPGLFVQATLNLRTEPDAVVVPAAAVQVSQDGQYVYVVKPDQTAELRPVTVERQQEDQMVIARGLSGGEEVVTDGQLRLTPGAPVVAHGAPGDPGEE